MSAAPWEVNETHYPTNPDFYPGESDAFWGATGPVENALYSAGSVSYILEAGAFFMAGGGAWYYGSYTPRPVILQGRWVLKVRGSGTLTFSLGLDALSDWDWYYSTREIAWTSAGSQQVNSAVDYVDLIVPIPPAVFTQTNMENGTFMVKVDITSGSVEFDMLDFQCAGSDGYHVATSSGQYSAWQDRQSHVVNNSAGRVSYAESAVLMGTDETVLYYRGTEPSPPAIEIRAQVDVVAGQIYGATQAAGGRPAVSRNDPTYYAPVGSYYTDGPYSRSYFTLEDKTAQWDWADAGTPPDYAYWFWGVDDSSPDLTQSAYERATMYRCGALSFAAASVTKPTINTLMANAGLVANVHYSSGQYETGVLSEFVSWEPTAPVSLDSTWFRDDPTYTVTPPPYAYFPYPTYDDKHEHAMLRDQWQDWASAPYTLELRVVAGWEIGNPMPSPGDGILLGTVSFPLREYQSYETRPYYDGSINYGAIPYEKCGIFLSRAGGHAGTTCAIATLPRVILPRWHYWQPEWQYLGGYISTQPQFTMKPSFCY